MNPLKVCPHGRGGVGQPSGGECVRCQQITELIRDNWKWYWENRQERETQQRGRKADEGNGQPLPAGKMRKGALNARKEFRSETGPCKRQKHNNACKSAFDQRKMCIGRRRYMRWQEHARSMSSPSTEPQLSVPRYRTPRPSASCLLHPRGHRSYRGRKHKPECQTEFCEPALHRPWSQLPQQFDSRRSKRYSGISSHDH